MRRLLKKNPVAEVLKKIHLKVEKKGNGPVLHTADISREEREILMKTGWLEEIIQGWYILVNPNIQKGESTAWYASFWDFIRVYLSYHFGKNYCLTAECSLDLHLGKSTIPHQIIVIANKGRGQPIQLPHSTSLLIYADEKRLPEEKEEIKGIQVMSLPYALCRITPTFFKQSPKDAEIALRLVKSSSDLINVILKHSFKSAAKRLIGAYQFLKQEHMAQEIQKGLERVGFLVDAENPFETKTPQLMGSFFRSSIEGRIFSMWRSYRDGVIKHFPASPGIPKNISAYLKHVNAIYLQDAYNSLSIEGYLVNEELIEKVANNRWNPDLDFADQAARNALAARGYYEAFQAVKESVTKILQKEMPGKVLEQDLAQWYQKLFAPSVTAGIIPPTDLFGYRRGQVYIRNSRHTPPPKESLLDAMGAFFECLKKENHPAVRAVLGHFIFVYIHPYIDGNGRIGRFIMNAMLASGGYPWTVIHVENRNEYFSALEKGSVEENIIPFTKFIAKETT